MIARQQGLWLADLAAEVATPVLGESSLKAALYFDWDDPAAREQTLEALRPQELETAG